MATVVRRNERSWAIDLISKINLIAKNNDLVIKKAGGENTISTGRGNTMFPDVVLYGNVEQSVILQGWELKMPDVPIEDETFIKDAQRKAIPASFCISAGSGSASITPPSRALRRMWRSVYCPIRRG